MPAGLNKDIGFHYLAFAAIKFVGYSLFAKHLNFSYGKEQNIWKVGGFRMLLGIILGAPFGYYFSGYFFIVGLVLLRCFEWFVTIWLFYDEELKYKKKLSINVLKGIAVSFILDIPAGLGFIFTGGMWIC